MTSTISPKEMVERYILLAVQLLGEDRLTIDVLKLAAFEAEADGHPKEVVQELKDLLRIAPHAGVTFSRKGIDRP